MAKELIRKPTSRFLKVKCTDCGNEQILFDRPSTAVACQACGHELATPGGGLAKIAADVVEELR